jgi:hypothetical protein
MGFDFVSPVYGKNSNIELVMRNHDDKDSIRVVTISRHNHDTPRCAVW